MIKAHWLSWWAMTIHFYPFVFWMRYCLKVVFELLKVFNCLFVFLYQCDALFDIVNITLFVFSFKTNLCLFFNICSNKHIELDFNDISLCEALGVIWFDIIFVLALLPRPAFFMLWISNCINFQYTWYLWIYWINFWGIYFCNQRSRDR